MSNMKNCPFCGEPLAKSAKFCPKCGAANKKPIYKRIWFLTICVIVAIVAIGMLSESNQKQKALLTYINDDLPGLAEIEGEMFDSYNSVTGKNYTDDFAMYNEINDKTIPLCHELNDKVYEIDPRDPEISVIHNIYRKCVRKYLNAFIMINASIENRDATQIIEANNLIGEAADMAEDFKQALYKLADERNVVFED